MYSLKTIYWFITIYIENNLISALHVQHSYVCKRKLSSRLLCAGGDLNLVCPVLAASESVANWRMQLATMSICAKNIFMDANFATVGAIKTHTNNGPNH